MGWKSKPAPAPPPPDYAALAREQAKLQNEATDKQTLANRADQYTPEGSLTWSQDPATGRWTQTTKYSADVEAARQAQMATQAKLSQAAQGMTDRAMSATENPFSYEGMTEIGGYDPSKVQGWGQVPGQGIADWANIDMSGLTEYGQVPGQGLTDFAQTNTDGMTGYGSYDPSQLGQYGSIDFSKLGNLPDAGFGAVEGIRDAMMSRLQPSLTQGRDREIQRLKAQGITEGTPAWQAAMQSLNQRDVDANQQALLGGAQEYGNIWNRSMQGRQQGVNEQLAAAQYANALRNQQFGEQGTMANFADRQRQQQLAERMGLTGEQNQLRQQQLQEQFGISGYQDAQRAQQLGEREGLANFQNQLRGSQFNEQSAQAAYANALRGMQMGEQGLMRDAQGQDRQRQIQEALFLRQNPLNELNAFMSSGQVSGPQFGNYNQAGASAAPDIYGAAKDTYKAQMDAYNAAQASKGNLMGGLLGMAGKIGGSVLGGPIGGMLGSWAGDKLGGMFSSGPQRLG